VSVVEAVARGLAPAFRGSLEGMQNPYGDGSAAKTIADVLCRVPLGESLLLKRAPVLPSA